MWDSQSRDWLLSLSPPLLQHLWFDHGVGRLIQGQAHHLGRAGEITAQRMSDVAEKFLSRELSCLQTLKVWGLQLWAGTL